MSGKYILDPNGEPSLCGNLLEWAEWFEKAERRVARDVIGDVTVSTVFLGLDHSFRSQGPPVVWETMVFGGKYDQEQDRYTSREQAEQGHHRWVKKVAR